MHGLQGAAVYAPEKEAMVWKIKNFPGGKEFLLRCKFGLPSVEAEEEAKGRMPPIRVKFEIPYFTVSGIQVTFAAGCSLSALQLKHVQIAGFSMWKWQTLRLSGTTILGMIASSLYLMCNETAMTCVGEVSQGH